MNKTEFVKDFAEFFIEIEREGITTSLKDVTTLYAIYRKDFRAERLNNKANSNTGTNGNDCNGINGSNKPNDPGKEPATERQKHYLMDLAYKKGLCMTQKELDRMTREQASKTIDTLLEGD